MDEMLCINKLNKNLLNQNLKINMSMPKFFQLFNLILEFLVKQNKKDYQK